MYGIVQNMEQIIEAIEREKLIVIVRGVAAEKCLPVAQALYDGGVRVMEITFDASAPESWQQTASAIGVIAKSFDGRMAVGAGTVLTVEQVELTARAGGQFIVSPDTCESVIRRTHELGMVSIPGALSATEVTAAYRAGADFVKLFPAGSMGVGYFKAIKAPLNHIKLLAVGGITTGNVQAFAAAGACGYGVSSSLVRQEWCDSGAYDKIRSAAESFVTEIKKAHG